MVYDDTVYKQKILKQIGSSVDLSLDLEGCAIYTGVYNRAALHSKIRSILI